MVKTTSEFNINVSKANRAIGSLDTTVRKYNETVRDTSKAQKEATREALRAEKEYSQLATKTNSLKKSILDLKTTAQQYARSIATADVATRRAAGSYDALRTNVRSLAAAFASNISSVQRTGIAAAGAVTQFNNLSRTTQGTRLALRDATLAQRQNTGAVNRGTASLTTMAQAANFATTATVRDAVATRRSTDAIREFRREIAGVVSRMQGKNATLRDQTRLMDRDRVATQRLTFTWRDLFRVLLIQEIHRAFGLLANGIRDSIDQARQLSLRIAEVRTIQGQAALTSDDWGQKLRSLSDSFGIPILEATEGAYQAISNQVVTAANATGFLREEAKLAITTQATLEQAVDATSTVLNAYSLTSNEAATVNAKLFKGVEIGRFRLEELGSQFGRTSVLASQLKVSLDEELAALTLLTRKGLQADVALTLLTNVFNSLLKPSEEMSKFLKQIGVNSGEAAIRTFGFQGVLGKLAAQAQATTDPLSEISSLFLDLRALTGATALTGFFDEFGEDLRKISKESLPDFEKAVDISFESLGLRANKQLEQLRNSLTFTFGEPILRGLVKFGEFVGGAGNGLNSLLAVVRQGVATFVAYRAILFATNIQHVAQIRNLALTRTGFVLIDPALRRITAELSFAQIRMAGLTFGLSLLAGKLVEVGFEVDGYKASMDLAVQATDELRQKTSADQLKKNLEDINFVFARFSEVTDANIKALRVFFADTQAKSNGVVEANKKAFDAITKLAEASSKKISSVLEKSIRDDERALDKLKSDLERATAKIAALKLSEEEASFEAVLATEDELGKAKRLEAEKNRVHAEALAARKRGETELADELFDRAVELGRRELDTLKGLRDKALADIDRSKDSGRVTVTRPEIATDPFGRPKFDKRGRPLFVKDKETLKIPEEEKEVAATKELAEIEARLLELDAERTKNAQERIKLLEAEAATEAAKIAKAEQAAIDRELAFDVLKQILDDLNNFDFEAGDPKVFAQKVKQLETVAGDKDLGLTPAQQLELLKDFKQQTVIFAKDAADKEAAIELEKNKKILEDNIKIFEATKKLAQDAANAQATQAQEAIKALDELLQRVRQFDQENIFGKFVDGKNIAGVKQKGVIVDDVLNDKFNAFVNRLEAVKNALTNAKAQGGDLGHDLEKLAQLQDEFEAFADTLTPDKVTALGRFAREFRALREIFDPDINAPAKDAKGNFALAKGDVSLLDRLKAVRLVTDELNKAQAAQEAANKKLVELQPIIQGLEEQVNAVPHAELEAALAAEQWANRSDVAFDQIAAGLDGLVQRLLTIRNLQNNMGPNIIPGPGRAFGGAWNKAFGGAGIDTRPALLARDEMVMTQSVSRAFGPFLHALNGATPVSRAHGGSVTFGDIHINAPEGTTQVQARDLFAQFQRLARRGLIRK